MRLNMGVIIVILQYLLHVCVCVCVGVIYLVDFDGSNSRKSKQH
jgi:hypothetical protein